MIEVRVFATLRQGRDKVTMLPPEGIACAGDVLKKMGIPANSPLLLLEQTEKHGAVWQPASGNDLEGD